MTGLRAVLSARILRNRDNEFIFLFLPTIRTYLGPKKLSRKFCDVRDLQKTVANGEDKPVKQKLVPLAR